MDIQYLDGIDIQYLDGTNAANEVVLDRINGLARRRADHRVATIQALTRGLTNTIAAQAEDIANGNDFRGFNGDGSVADEEMIRTHLMRTKEVADAAPSMVATYGNPQTLSNMIGYVLNRWDTPEREEAIDYMIAEEKKLEGLGRIDTNADTQRGELTAEAYYDVDSYMYGLGAAKNTFFTSVKRALKPTLTTEAQDIVASNPALQRIRAERRNAIAQARRAKGRANDADVRGLSGTDDNDIECLMNGTDLQYAFTNENPLTSIARYIQRTKRVAEQHPEYFDSAADSQAVANACSILLRSWENEKLRNAAFDSIIMACDDVNSELNGRLRKALKKAAKKIKSAAKKVGSAVKTAAKKVATAVKKAVKKVGKAIAKVAKKVWKFIVRFNPLTLLIRAGILGFCRLNMFKVANKCYIGSLSKEEALKKGATAAEWEKSNKAYGHLKNAYTKIGGKESKLKKVLEKGNKKKWNGTEYPTDGNSIKSAAQNVNAADNKEAQADMDYDETLKEYQKNGYVSDSTISTDTATQQKKEEVTIIENERTAKVATKLYETDETTGKVLVTIPKAAKVLVDTAQTSGNFIAATYNGKNGWVTKNDLAGLGNCDAESVAVIGLGAIYDEYTTMGLGEPATATAVASASSVIASIMAKIKSIFGVAKNVVDKVKAVASTAKKVANTAKNVANVVKDPNAALKSAATKAADKITNGAASNIKSAVNTAKATATSAIQNVKAVQNVAKAVNTAKNTANAIKSNVQTAKQLVNQTKDIAKTAVSTVNQNVAKAAVQAVKPIATTPIVKPTDTTIVAPKTATIQQSSPKATTTSATSKPRAQQVQQTQPQQAQAPQPTLPNETASTPQPQQQKSGLSTGAKIGIGLGVLALAGLTIYMTRKK